MPLIRLSLFAVTLLAFVGLIGMGSVAQSARGCVTWRAQTVCIDPALIAQSLPSADANKVKCADAVLTAGPVLRAPDCRPLPPGETAARLHGNAPATPPWKPPRALA